MSYGPTYKMPFKRKMEQKTNYVKRLATLKSGKLRFAVRLSNNFVLAQIIEYSKEGDKTLFSVTSKSLLPLGWKYSLKNTPAIYLTSFLLANMAKKKNINEVIFDTGVKNFKKGSRIFASLKAITDAGLNCPYNEETLPSIDRISGKHISEEVSLLFNEISKKISSK